MLTSVLQSGQSTAPAVVIPEGPTISYGELTDEIERVAGLLAGMDMLPGSTVSIVLGNNLEYLVVFLAVTRAGAIAAPLNPAYTADEFQFYMEDADAKLAIVPPGKGEARSASEKLGIPVLEAISADDGHVRIMCKGTELAKSKDAPVASINDVALFLHTSGTTSRPKGVPLTHANLLASLENIRGTYRLTPEDVSLIVMPLFHVHGLLGAALATLSSGGSIVVPSRFSASTFWPLQQATGATWYSAVPTIHKILLDRADQDKAPTESFRFIRSCSSALAATVLRQLEERFEAPVLEAYGMTEASHQMSSNPLPPDERLPGTVGKGTGVGISIMDDGGKILGCGEIGEVVIQGSNVMHGYTNNPTANADAFSNGWFRTGDQGVLAEDGYLTLTGRIKELINRGGEKISPLEVEEIILGHPAVADAVCFGVLDSKYGEAVHAAVVLKGDSTEDAIKTLCGEKLASFKVPDRVHITDELPRTATGKVQRRHMAAVFAGKT